MTPKNLKIFNSVCYATLAAQSLFKPSQSEPESMRRRKSKQIAQRLAAKKHAKLSRRINRNK